MTPEVLHAGSGQYLDWGGRIEAVFAFARIWRIVLHGGQEFTFGMHRTGVWTGAGTRRAEQRTQEQPGYEHAQYDPPPGQGHDGSPA